MLNELAKQDAHLIQLEKYIAAHPDVIPSHGGEILIPEKLVHCGDELTIRLVSYGSYNAALTVTHNCFAPESEPEQIPLNFAQRGENFFAEVKLRFLIPGNTRIEYWVNSERLVRQIAVLDTGYMAVIPWVGANTPYLDEELHRFDLPGDYWVPDPSLCANPEEAVRRFEPYIRNARRYGDRIACLLNARTLVPSVESDSLFELPRDVQEKGIGQIKRQMELLGFESMELVASYTPNSDTIDILEKMGVKALTSLCAWQNWQDHGWKINHCGVANQPYYPGNDDFRRAGKQRDIMCFTMGNASCNRNYSIMVLDGCPTNIVPGERYLANRVVNQQMQRFYDTFDGYINDSKNNDSLLTVTIALESFAGKMDWNATNEAAIRYMVKKAASEKIVFTSAADVADYHRKNSLNMQSAYFFQPDYYYGYHNGTMPGRIDDRLEADTCDYLAVIRRSSMLPMYFYDYTVSWDSCLFEDTERNEFGLIDPDEHKPSECFPKQVFTEDMRVSSAYTENGFTITIESETYKKRMVTGMFDIPYTWDFVVSFDKLDATAKKIYDDRTGNTHLFIDLGVIQPGTTVVTAEICGDPRLPENPELIKDGFAAMYFGDHAYLRSTDKESAIHVEMPAPQGAFLRLISGKKIKVVNGKLSFDINACWENESAILYGYEKALLAENLSMAKICVTGPTSCSRWSGQ